jgi:hypothetical protein
LAHAAKKGDGWSYLLPILPKIRVERIMKMMILKRLGLVAGVQAAFLLAGCGAKEAGSQTIDAGVLTAKEIAGKTRAAYAALSSYSDTGKVVSEMSGQINSLTFNIRLQRPNLYRIDWAQGTGLKGVVWSGGSGDYLQIEPGSRPEALSQIVAGGQKNDPNPQKMPDMKMALARATALSWSATSTIPGAFFGQEFGDVFAVPAISGNFPLQNEKDEKVGGMDCYVISTEMDLSKVPNAGKPGTVATKLWIGKKDFLIHQSRTRYVEKVDDSAMSSDQAIDEAIKKSLEMQNKPATPEAIAAMRPQMRATMKQVQTTLKAGFEAGLVMTQTHENISVNQKFPPSAFAR